MTDYEKFLVDKTQYGKKSGFKPTFIPEKAFDFQKSLIEYGVDTGRCALFEDCGLGKTLQELAIAQNWVEHTNKPVLILEPLAVAAQTIREGEKFGIECHRSNDGNIPSGAKIIITNYEKLHLFDWKEFEGGCICDESSILKNFDGTRKDEITQFMRKLPRRLLGTATAAPNDFIELGTSSEALGQMGYMDMLGRFFKNNQSTSKPRSYRHGGKNYEKEKDKNGWRFKGHAELPFWQWVCSWSRAVRRPSDIGFDNGPFVLPPLIERQHIVQSEKKADGYLFSLPAAGLREQREERRRSIQERCAMVAKLASTKEQFLIGVHLNPEGDLLEEMIPDAIQISGKDSDEAKEERLLAFVSGQARVLVSKSIIVGFGLNMQNCHRVIPFPSHSYEQYYQFIRRSWRFGQTEPVQVDIVASEGELNVLKNLQRKSLQADRMFDNLIKYMNQAMQIDIRENLNTKEKVPSWLKNK